MTLNEGLIRQLIETPGVPGREEQQRAIAREELGGLTDEVRTDALGSVIGTRKGRGDMRVMVAAHTDEIGFLVKHIDDKGFLRLQTLGGHDPANMVSQRVIVTTAGGNAFRGALQPQRKPRHIAGDEANKVPKVEESFVDLGMPAAEVKEKVRVGDYAVMDRTLEKVGGNYMGKAMDDRIGVFVMYEAMRALGDHEATVYVSLDDELSSGDKVVTRWTSRGTHRGELMGIAPTCSRIEVTAVGIWRVADGKIAEAWLVFDALGMMQQLGVASSSS